MKIDWPSVENRLYQVQWASEFSEDGLEWESFGVPILGDGTTNSVFAAASSGSPRFYRVAVIEPAPKYERALFAWGVSGHPLGQVGYMDIAITNQLDLIQALGAKWYRVDLGRSHFGPGLEELVGEAHARGIQILPILIPGLGREDITHTLGELYQEAYEAGQNAARFFRGRLRVCTGSA